MNRSLNSIKLRWLWLSVIVFIVDLESKFLVLKNLDPGCTVSLIPSLNLYYTRNYGVAFSLLSDCSNWLRLLLTGIAVIICVVLVVLMYLSKDVLNNIAYSLIIGGASGNLLDRLCLGFVIDMIDFHICNWHFATFNLADSAISIGATLIVLKGFLSKKTT